MWSVIAPFDRWSIPFLPHADTSRFAHDTWPNMMKDMRLWLLPSHAMHDVIVTSSGNRKNHKHLRMKRRTRHRWPVDLHRRMDTLDNVQTRINPLQQRGMYKLTAAVTWSDACQIQPSGYSTYSRDWPTIEIDSLPSLPSLSIIQSIQYNNYCVAHSGWLRGGSRKKIGGLAHHHLGGNNG